MASSERVRVLRVIARLNVGGPALHAVLLSERLDPSRYDSTLVAGRLGAGEGDYLALRGKAPGALVAVPALGREIHPARDLGALATLVRLIRRVRPHIVHTHTAKAGTLGRIAAALCGVPVIVHTFHGHVFEGYFPPRRARLLAGIERRLAGRTTALLAVSERVRRDVLDLGIGRPEQVRVMPLGLDLQPLLRAGERRGELRRELRVSERAALVGIVARLVPIKAHETFLDAAALVARHRPDALFLVVGDGERRAELEARAAAPDLAGRVRFLGWRADLDRVYADLDVTVLTSRNEGSPVALIEAMAAERPVVSTRAGGVEDVVEDERTGLLAPVGDADAVARAVLRVLEDPALGVRLGTAARVHVEPRFGSARLVQDVDALYRRLLAAAGQGVPVGAGGSA